MANIHTFLHRIYIRTLRFRHRNGYGVHSPFAYNLIKGVIYESHMYYAYPELARMRGSYTGRLSVSGRMDRLMFRLANYVRPEKAAIVGRNRGVTGKYVAAGCRKAQVMQADSPAGMAGKRYDLCYVAPGEDAYGAFMNFAPGAGPQSLFVAAGIYATPAARRNWENIRKDPRSVVTFDLYEAGLVFFDSKLNKQNHIVSF